MCRTPDNAARRDSACLISSRTEPSSTVALPARNRMLRLLRLAPSKARSSTSAACVDSESGTRKPPACSALPRRGASAVPAPTSTTIQVATMNQRRRTTACPQRANGSAMAPLAALGCEPERVACRLRICQIELLGKHHDLAARDDEGVDQRKPRNVGGSDRVRRDEDAVHSGVADDVRFSERRLE